MDDWFEMNLTQRRKERLRMTLCVLASLRLCVNFYAVFEALSKIVLRHVKNVSLGAKGDYVFAGYSSLVQRLTRLPFCSFSTFARCIDRRCCMVIDRSVWLLSINRLSPISHGST